jgi:hypothetical protein
MKNHTWIRDKYFTQENGLLFFRPLLRRKGRFEMQNPAVQNQNQNPKTPSKAKRENTGPGPLTVSVGEQNPEMVAKLRAMADQKRAAAEAAAEEAEDKTLKSVLLNQATGFQYFDKMLEGIAAANAPQHLPAPQAIREHLVSDRGWCVKADEKAFRNNFYGDWVLGPVELVEDSPLGVILKGAGGVMVGKKLIDMALGLFSGSPEDVVEAALK